MDAKTMYDIKAMSDLVMLAVKGLGSFVVIVGLIRLYIVCR